MKTVAIVHTDVASDAGDDELDCLRQADVVSDALTTLGYRIVRMPFVLDLEKNIRSLQALKPDIVFNLVETVAGRGSMIHFATALFDYLRIPYTGCRSDAMYLTSNKPLAKKLMFGAGISTPRWMTLDGSFFGGGNVDTYLLKACWEDASVGLDEDSIIRCADRTILVNALRKRSAHLGTDCFAEAYIEGREFNLALLGRQDGPLILPPAEMLFKDYPPGKPKLLDYRAKWVENSFEYDHTERTLDIAPEDRMLTGQLCAIARACWDLFGLRGYARVDFRVDSSGQPFVLEMNANPCLSPDAGFAAALERATIPFADAISDILQDAVIP